MKRQECLFHFPIIRISDKQLVSNRNNSTVCSSPYNDKFTLNPTLIYEVSLELLFKITEHRCLFSPYSTHGYWLENVNKIKLNVIFSGYSALCTTDLSTSLFIGVIPNLINLKSG